MRKGTHRGPAQERILADLVRHPRVIRRIQFPNRYDKWKKARPTGIAQKHIRYEIFVGRLLYGSG